MNNIPSRTPPPLPQQENPSVIPSIQRVSVVDFDMSFGQMIIFMIKWAFAAIPALIIIWMVMFFFFLIVMMFFGGIAALSQHH